MAVYLKNVHWVLPDVDAKIGLWKKIIEKLQVTQRSMHRYMLRIFRSDRESLEWIIQKTQSLDHKETDMVSKRYKIPRGGPKLWCDHGKQAGRHYIVKTGKGSAKIGYSISGNGRNRCEMDV